jgi:hypothetical protein
MEGSRLVGSRGIVYPGPAFVRIWDLIQYLLLNFGRVSVVASL